MKIKPLHDRIVLKPSDKETTTASGIILPDSAQEKPLRGTVIAVGPGKQLDTGKLSQMDVSVGDVVLFGKYSGTDVQIEGEDLVILRQEDVLAILAGAKERELVGTAKRGRK